MIRAVTTNSGKFREIAAALEPHVMEQVDEVYPEIQADSLGDVVLFAIRSLDHVSGDLLVDDSGLFVGALGGFPGVYSAHAFETLGCSGILRLMDGAPDRAAVFRTCLGLRFGGKVLVLTGECEGRITNELRGEGGFGFDPIFVPEGHERTFAEMDLEEKNAVSHRGRALAAVKRLLEGLAVAP